MTLPIPRSYAPMDALLVADLPAGPQWQYEPKWDGFRCLAFRDGPKIDLMSKSGKSLARYFPDIVAALGALRAKQFVLDGELLVPIGGALSFDELLLRIHPAKSRVDVLARERPARFIVFDQLVDAKGRSLVGQPLSERRAALESFAADYFPARGTLRISPATRSRAVVRKWQKSIGSGLDGLIAKRCDLPYRSGERTGMQKVKHMRTADCVVGGFRYGAKQRVVGSLLLGLYDDEGLLHHVGFTSALKATERAPFTRELERLVQPPGFSGQRPGGPSRWSSERSGEWEPLASKRVVEVRYDHFSGGRFRHGTQLLRWRPDKAPRQCTLAQVEREGRSALKLLGGATR